MTLFDKLDTSSLPDITPGAVADFQKQSDLLLKRVNGRLSSRADLESLIGDNSLDLMFNNHKNHLAFMTNIFKLNDYEMLVNTIPWVYHTYQSRGFSYNYFEEELQAWREAIAKYLKEVNADLINQVYDFLIDNHHSFIETARKTKFELPQLPQKWAEIYDFFIQCLLEGYNDRCLQMSGEEITTKDELIDFYEYLVKPVMYDIGQRWEKNEISVAEEHLASSIITRILSTQYSRFVDSNDSQGTIVITAIANEYHEIGSRIIADALEFDGWDVHHLGADTPVIDLIEFLKEKQPFLLGLSAALPVNIENVIDTIAEIRTVNSLQDLSIMVGGKVFNDHPDLWKKTGADLYAADSRQVVKKVRELYAAKKGDK